MKKSTVCWIIVAASLVLVGGMLIVSAAVIGSTTALSDFEWSQLSPVEYAENTYEMSDEIQRLHITTETANILLKRADGENCKVVCRETDMVFHSVSVADGTLTVDVVDIRKWYHRIGFFFGKQSVTVYLPGRVYDSLTVETDTGNLEIPDDFTFTSIRVNGDTGYVNCKATVQEQVDISLSTGDVTLVGLTAGSIRLTASTGDISMDQVACEGEMKLTVSTGRITLTDITAHTLTADASTGDIRLINVQAESRLALESSTGDVTMNGCDAKDLIVRTNTGNITATLLSPKMFSADSDTGRIILPPDGGEGRCQVTTDTGNIRIEILPTPTP